MDQAATWHSRKQHAHLFLQGKYEGNSHSRIERAIQHVVETNPERCTDYYTAQGTKRKTAKLGTLIGLTFKQLGGVARLTVLRQLLKAHLENNRPMHLSEHSSDQKIS